MNNWPVPIDKEYHYKEWERRTYDTTRPLSNKVVIALSRAQSSLLPSVNVCCLYVGDGYNVNLLTLEQITWLRDRLTSVIDNIQNEQIKPEGDKE